MIALLCGGPFAARVFDVREPLPPTIVIPVCRSLATWAEGDEALDVSVVPERVEYRKGGETNTVAGRICAYHFIGEDKYRTARTFERLVPFRSPDGMTELDDKISVDWLLVSCGMKQEG